MAIDNSGESKVRGFILYPIGLKVSQCPAYSSDVLKFVTAAERYALESIEHDDFAGKLNQSKFVVFNYDSSGLIHSH